MAEPGIADQRIHRAEMRLGGIEGGDHAGLVGHIHPHRQGAFAEFPGQLLQPVEVARCQHHPCAGAIQHAGEAFAEAR